MQNIGERYAVAIERWQEGDRGLRTLCQELEIDPIRFTHMLRDLYFKHRVTVSMSSRPSKLRVGDVLEFLEGHDKTAELEVSVADNGVVTLSIDL